MSRARFAVYFVLTAIILAGCGQSGPLYMPGNPSQMTVPATQPAESTDDSEDADASDNE